MLTIPEGHVECIKDMVNLTAHERSEILKALKSSKIFDDATALCEEIARLSGIEEDKVFSAIIIASSINRTAFSSNQAKNEIIEELSQTLRFNPEQPISISNEQKAFLLSFSDNNVVKSTIKSEILKEGFEHTFESLKIITDLRPIFSDDGKNINSSTIINTMVLELEKDDEVYTQHFTISEKDIDTMISVLQRAKMKNAVLKSCTLKGNSDE